MFDETAKISLLVSEKVASIEVERETLVLRYKKDALRKYPVRALRKIILLHSCTIHSGTLVALAEANVPLMLFNGRGEYAAAIYPGPIKNFYPRQAQFDAYRDPPRRLEVARHIVAAKLQAMRRLAREREDLYDFAAEDEAVAGAADLQALRGAEGAATREHYQRLLRLAQ